ncbi:DUF2950 domain-containing protein [Dyella solisilvae]|uniref:DUF2950 domain-containing protein n=1 Tax=Dyella solisilvae TaxID=1920168 RepID=A0A370KA36_9GAMM|nr:DUF2950 domain-containing protein [Dyella solisilvae]RDI99495.1 DUF2950 domain-containing protein [Dyella solisilvae]
MNRTPNSLRLAAALMLWTSGVALAAAVAEQTNFPSADAAATAFVQAVRSGDKEGLAKVLGGNWRDYVPEGDVDREDVDLFLKRYDASHRIDAGQGVAHLEVGSENWELPLPIVQGTAGWHFDLKKGAEEVRVRRIGANELSAQQAMLAYYDAQREYATEDRDGDHVLQYAQKLRSSPGKHDGLYWPVTGNEEQSPLGERFADVPPPPAGQGFHGYRYRILTAQGPSAPGGAYNYVVGGRMTSGFALVAWPAEYGETGVMSFMVSHDGEVFEKDLGKNGQAIAQAMKSFDPDSSWEEVKPGE